MKESYNMTFSAGVAGHRRVRAIVLISASPGPDSRSCNRRGPTTMVVYHLRASPSRLIRERGTRALTALMIALLCAASCVAIELEKATIAAFDHYVDVAEQQMHSSLRADGPFLWIDLRPEAKRDALYAQLRSGQFVIRQLNTYDDAQKITIPDGMVHHWIGLAYVPGATLKTAEAVLEDYQDYSRIYAPEVRRSRIYGREGDEFRLYMQLYKDSPRVVSYNANFDIQRMHLGPDRIASSSVSTRIAQLQDPGKPDGAEYPVGEDSGYLWRMNDYWRYEQKDGGVYMQVEAISLSRDVPAFLGWIVRPIIRRVARETIADLLEANRRAIENPHEYAPHAIEEAAGSAPRSDSSPGARR